MVVDNPYYSSDVHGPYELADIGDLVLEEGATLRGASWRTRRWASSTQPRTTPCS